MEVDSSLEAGHSLEVRNIMGDLMEGAIMAGEEGASGAREAGLGDLTAEEVLMGAEVAIMAAGEDLVAAGAPGEEDRVVVVVVVVGDREAEGDGDTPKSGMGKMGRKG